MSGVTISALIKKMNLELLTKEINTDTAAGGLLRAF